MAERARARRPPGDEQHTGMKRRLMIGLRMHQLREGHGGGPVLSLAELADFTVQVDYPDHKGIHPATLYRVEKGEQTARAETVHLIAAAFSKALGRTVTMDELYQGGGSVALGGYLVGEQQRRRMDNGEFSRLIGLREDRYLSLVHGHARWNPLDLPGIVRALPETGPLVVTTLAEHGGRRVKREAAAA